MRSLFPGVLIFRKVAPAVVCSSCLFMTLKNTATSSLLLVAACFVCLSCAQTNTGELYMYDIFKHL